MLTQSISVSRGTPAGNAAPSNPAPQAPPQAPPANQNQPTTGDRLALTRASSQRNPYEGVAPSFNTVKVDPWGQGGNDSVAQILLNQGYSTRDLYKKSRNGRTLLEEVGRVNGLRNPDLIRAGQNLVVPNPQRAREEASAPAATPAPQQQTAPTPAPQNPANGNEGAKINQVTVDRWGQGPNSTLGAILRNQGFNDREIFKEDANGDSLLKKVARANGLESPDRIQAGSTLRVPGDMDALNQMNVPAAPARVQTPPPAPAAPQTPAQTPPAQTPAPRVEQPAPAPSPAPTNDSEGEPTANMGMLLDGIKNGQFSREEFSYLNARSSRYAQMRARFSNDGYTNDELKQLGQMEQRYGVEFARLAARDDIALPEFNSSNPDLAIQVKHYRESGPLYEGYKNGTTNAEAAISLMVRQRAEARRQEVR